LYGAFTRTFTLPAGTDTEHANAELKDGVLAVVVPTWAEVMPKKNRRRPRREASGKGVR
jgi:HSP20 family protein